MSRKKRRTGWMLFPAASMLAACGGDTNDGAGACGIAGCGGDVSGTWMITDVCVGGSVSTGVGACDAVGAAALASAKVDPNGATINFSNGTYSGTGTARMSAHYDFTNACLMAQGAQGASDATCSSLQSSLVSKGFSGTCGVAGATCACDVTQDVPLTQSGSYRVDGANLVFDQDKAGSPFCVHGNTGKVSSPNGMSFSGSFSITRGQ